MALIPGLSTFSFLKLFRTDPSRPQVEETVDSSRQLPQDIVDLSALAQKKLEGLKLLSDNSPDQVQNAAVQTRGILEQTSYVLGLQPGTY